MSTELQLAACPRLGAVEPVEPHQSSHVDPAFRRLRLRYAGKCVLCGSALAKGAEALYHPATKTTRCLECPSSAVASISPRGTDSAGASAHREYQRRRTAREALVKGRLGNFVGGIALTLSGEPQSTVALERGSIGEQKLAEALEGVQGIDVLSDRRVAGTRGNIDHIVIAPAGVFVVDAKHYEGLIRIRNRGGLLGRDDRLYVGSRDCSRLAENMVWQVAAVKRVIDSIGAAFASVPVEPVLCFVDGEWPLVAAPESFRGVRLEGKRSIKKLVTRSQLLDAKQIAAVSRTLAIAFPAK